MLYVKPEPVGLVTIKLPVGVEQVGCVKDTTGVVTEGLIVPVVPDAARQPPALFTVTV